MIGYHLYRVSYLDSVSGLPRILAAGCRASVAAITCRTLLAQAVILSMALILSEFLLLWSQTASNSVRSCVRLIGGRRRQWCAYVAQWRYGVVIRCLRYLQEGHVSILSSVKKLQMVVT
jgi:hypothetical protein